MIVLNTSFCCRCFVRDADFNCKSENAELCSFMLTSNFDGCIKLLKRDLIMEYVKSCEIDICSNDITSLHEISCKAIEALAQLCEYSGSKIDWRTDSDCGKFH